MKTEYQKMYEYLTPLLLAGKLTTTEMAAILAPVKILEMRVNVAESLSHDLYAESKREDLEQEASYENLTINEETKAA